MHDEPAIHVDRLTGHVAGTFGRKKDDHIGDVLRGLPPLERNDLLNLAFGPLFVAQFPLIGLQVAPGLPHRSIERSLNHAGADRVHADSVGCQVFGQALGEIDVRCLGCRIRRIGLRTDLTSDRSDKDHRSGVLLAHAGTNGMRDMGHAQNVHFQSSPPVLGREVVEGKSIFPRSDCRSMHEMIDPAPLLEAILRRTFQLLEVGDVHNFTVDAVWRNCEIPADDLGSFGGKQPGCGQADATGRPGDDDALIFKIQVHLGCTFWLRLK